MSQPIIKERRTYNRYVANQTLEDYSLRYTDKSARTRSAFTVSIAAVGSISFLALEVIGANIAIFYGLNHLFYALLIAMPVIFFISKPIAFYAVKYNVDIDLLTRGAGFGYLGSSITSLVYASFAVIFFAFEATILANLLNIFLQLPLFFGYFFSSLVIIPLILNGFSFISKFQRFTQPIWVLLQLLTIVGCVLLVKTSDFSLDVLGTKSSFNFLFLGYSICILISLISQIGEQVDFLRFMPDKTSKNKKSYLLGTLIAGPGWIFLGGLKIFLGGVLGCYLLIIGSSYESSVDPNLMYLTAFEEIFGKGSIAVFLTIAFVVISQVKINITNGYAGSLAFSNFFSRLTHTHPGRVVWVFFNVFIAFILMTYGIYSISSLVLNIYAILAISWCGTIFSDLFINKHLGLSPKGIEFRRAYLYDINPVGVGSFVLSSIFGYLAFDGLFGITLEAYSAVFSFVLTLIFCPLFAYLTHGKFYLSRPTHDIKGAHECTVCKNSFEGEDLCYCPRYGGYICSLCCSLDSCCSDECKSNANIHHQVESLLPIKIRSSISLKVLKFVGYFVLYSAVNLAVFAISFYSIEFHFSQEVRPILVKGFTLCFFLFEFVFSIFSMLVILIEDSRLRTKNEFYNQNNLLEKEIQTRVNTEKLLQEAKASAEAANLAKTRYLSGISHELRTPLNTILGYGQILENTKDIPLKHKRAVGIMCRSSEYLANLIEGLLDISKIEAGRLDLHFDKVNINLMLEELAFYFNGLASKKHLSFKFEKLTAIPDLVTIDEKRFRQVLTNLLSNAVKYTMSGEVVFSISYKNEVADILVKDSGIGIKKDDIEKIFKPFNRLEEAKQKASGTGLGLTITNLLVTVMGGDLSVESEYGQGSTFRLKLRLSAATADPLLADLQRKVIGYKDSSLKQYNVLEVDDNQEHRDLMSAILEPVGFKVSMADCPDMALSLPNIDNFDLYLVDISMPGHDGWYLLKQLRQRGVKAPIVMVSAEASEGNVPLDIRKLHNGYIIKPFNQNKLFETISKVLPIDFIYEPKDIKQPQKKAIENEHIVSPSLNENGVGELAKKPEKVSSIKEQKLPKIEFERDIVEQYQLNIQIGYAKGLKKLNEKLFEHKIIANREKEILDLLVNELKFSEIDEILKVRE